MRFQEARLFAVGRMKSRYKVSICNDQSLPFNPMKALEERFHLPLEKGYILPAYKNAILDLCSQGKNKIQIAVAIDIQWSIAASQITRTPPHSHISLSLKREGQTARGTDE